MDIYNFDADTGAFSGVSQADPDPLSEGGWLIPAFATTLAPPDAAEGSRAVFSAESGWSIEPIPVVETPPTIEYPEPDPVPSAVSSRQFKLQLLAQGLLDAVDGWVKTQSQAVQISYEYSGTFVRSAPMMTEGFTAMGFTDQQIDAFFTAASKL